MFTALSAGKLVASTIVGIGTGKIVGKIIKNNVSPETLIEKVSVVAAGWVIGAMATQATKDYTGKMIDETVEQAIEIKNKIQHASKLGKINRGESTWAQEGLNQDDYRMDSKGIWSRREPVVTLNVDV